MLNKRGNLKTGLQTGHVIDTLRQEHEVLLGFFRGSKSNYSENV